MTKTHTAAQTMISQLGGAGRLSVMIGARLFVTGESTLQFRFMPGKQGINSVRITLDPSDTYSLEFYAIRGLAVKKLATRENVYADSLREVIENVTGLRLAF